MFTHKKKNMKAAFLRRKSLESPEDAIKRLSEDWDITESNSIAKGGLLVSKEASVDDLVNDIDENSEGEV